ncbi:MAG: hypothetical protein JWM29_1968 [Solirubrobacterales bacterium]|nr:hypothetical protein [Solirubrobacterales bacterium]
MTRPPPHSPLLNQRQLRRLQMLPDDYKVVGARDGIPIVESPTGQTLRLQSTGRLAATAVIERVESYLHIQRG